MSALCLSVVSHEQTGLLNHFLADLSTSGAVAQIDRLVVTSNVPEAGIMAPESVDFLHQRNPRPLGFAANHNRAFAACERPFFCVANPDIRLEQNPFPALLEAMERDPSIALIAPKVLDPRHRPEDNARHFPTPWSLVRKARGLDDGRYSQKMTGPTSVDWVAGMFLLIRAEAFQALSGFDEGFHLYYEDVDFCARAWKAGWKVQVHPEVSVIHDAQRLSRRNFRYMSWHAASMARYFAKHIGRLKHAPA